MENNLFQNIHIVSIGSTIIKSFVFLMMVLYLIYAFLFSRKQDYESKSRNTVQKVLLHCFLVSHVIDFNRYNPDSPASKIKCQKN